MKLHPAFAGSRPGLQSLACCWHTLWSITAQKVKGQLDSERWSTIPSFWLLLILYPWLKFPLSYWCTSVRQVTCLGPPHLGLQCNLLTSAILLIFGWKQWKQTHKRKGFLWNKEKHAPISPSLTPRALLSTPHHHMNTRISKGEDHRGNLEGDLIRAAAGKQRPALCGITAMAGPGCSCDLAQPQQVQRCAQIPMIVQRSSQSSSDGQRCTIWV